MSIVTLLTIAETRAAVATFRRNAPGKGIVSVVPTMGALHDGHAELIRRAHAESGFVLVTVFVNPLQFNNKEDLERYPRDLATDVALCAANGADAVFAPSVDEMYPPDNVRLTSVEVSALSSRLEGEFRPGHFKGVTTVVAKLLNIAAADKAYFGEKDFQQLALIRKMVFDLDMPTEIVPVATVREPDGLALSSRNRLLTVEDRALAPALHRALQEVRAHLRSGATPKQAQQAGLDLLAQTPQFRVEYLEVADAATLEPVAEMDSARPARILTAAWLGKVRLIDNIAAF